MSRLRKIDIEDFGPALEAIAVKAYGDQWAGVPVGDRAHAKQNLLDLLLPGIEWVLGAVNEQVAALLPQITTEAELEALPANTVVVDREGQPWQKVYDRWGGWGYMSEESSRWLFKNCGPTLTVVWQP